MDVVTLAKELISRPSITPNDAGCQLVIANYLQKLGFTLKQLNYADVNNLWAIKGESEPVVAFAGHTDVVPPGPLENWTSQPFQPEIRHGNLYGRGAADMKSSIAAMLIACENFLTVHPTHKGSLALLITSDEEGDAVNGTGKVVDYLQQQQQPLTYCIVGEASSLKTLGDTIKVGRRGSLHGHLTIQGKQGHVAYPQLADNPIHHAGSIIERLSAQHWDNGNDIFPPTSFQISNIHAGTGAKNVIPGALELDFNFRYAPVSSIETLKRQVNDILHKSQAKFHIQWNHSAEPFYTENKHLLAAVDAAIYKITGQHPQPSTTGGTSDGRFIAATGCAVVEIGPINASIHQVDEHINVNDLQQLTAIYQALLNELLS